MEIREINTQEDFDRELSAAGNKFILFYSAWDSFCLEFVPAYEKIASNNPVTFCKVSTDKLPETAVIFSVETVPTVLFLRGDKLEKRLDGIPEKGLTAEKLAEFVWLCRGIIKK